MLLERFSNYLKIIKIKDLQIVLNFILNNLTICLINKNTSIYILLKLFEVINNRSDLIFRQIVNFQYEIQRSQIVLNFILKIYNL